MEDELLLLDNQMNEEIKNIRDKYSKMKSEVITTVHPAREVYKQQRKKATKKNVQNYY